MGKGGGGSAPSGGGSQTSVTMQERPQWAQTEENDLLNRGTNTSKAPFSPYPWIVNTGFTNPVYGIYGEVTDRTPYYWYTNVLNNSTASTSDRLPYTSTVAPLSPETQLGLQWKTNQALQGNPSDVYGGNLSAATLRGDYLNPTSNPYLADTYNEAARRISDTYLNTTLPQLQSAANRAGAFGGSSDALLQGEAMKNLGQTLSDTAVNIYGPNYANERANQLKALALAPQTSGLAYNDINQLLGVGDYQNQYNQAVLSDLVNQWQAEQQWPYNQINFAGNVLNQATQGTGISQSTGSTQQTVPTSSAASNILGGASKGIGLGLAAASAGASVPLSAALGFLPFIGSLF